jgi:hypothetical protein
MIEAINAYFINGELDTSKIQSNLTQASIKQYVYAARSLYKKTGPSRRPFESVSQMRNLNDRLNGSERNLSDIIKAAPLCGELNRRAQFKAFDYLINNVTLSEKVDGKLNLLPTSPINKKSELAMFIWHKLSIITVLFVRKISNLRDVINDESNNALNKALAVRPYTEVDDEQLFHTDHKNLFCAVIHTILIHQLNHGAEQIRTLLNNQLHELDYVISTIYSMATEGIAVEYLNAE